jgi:hypothetical protein
MIRLKYFLFYSLLSIGFFACAQSKYAVKNIYSFYKVHLPGNIPVDENGNEIPSRDTVNLIFIESSKEDIHWDTAWKNGKTYFIIPTLIDTGFFDVGTNKMTNENMIIHAFAGNKLWQLQLIASEKKILQPSNILQGEILLRGTYNGKRILQKIKSQVELNSIPTQ